MSPIHPILLGFAGSKFPMTVITALGIPVRIPAMMMSETPLPIPNRSICSPSHIRKTVPAVSVTTAVTHQSGFFSPAEYTSPELVMKVNHPIAWTIQSPTVAYLVHSWIFC